MRLPHSFIGDKCVGMIPGILSIATPLFAYAAFVVLAAGLFCERKNIDWITAAVGTGALVASFVLVPPVHQLFFDEDIYIHIASNLAHAPVAKLTLLGSFENSEASAYYKSPVPLLFKNSAEMTAATALLEPVI